MTQLVGALLGAAIAFGLVLIVSGLVPSEIRERRRPVADRTTVRNRLAVSAGCFVAGWLATGWPAVGVLAAAAGVVGPGLLRIRREREASLALTEGLAGWAEMLRDTIAGHAGLQEAIGVTAEVAPPPIRDAVRRLAVRAERESLSRGLTRFAQEVADPVADLIVAALSVAADGQARDLPGLLSGIATSARAEAHMRLRVETGRARTYSSSRALVLMTLGLSLSLLVFAPEFMAPFSSLWGQLVLLVVAALFGGALWGLVALGKPAAVPRLLAGVADGGSEVAA